MEWSGRSHCFSYNDQHVQAQTATLSSAQDKLLHGHLSVHQASRPHLEEFNLLHGAAAPGNSPGNRSPAPNLLCSPKCALKFDFLLCMGCTYFPGGALTPFPYKLRPPPQFFLRHGGARAYETNLPNRLTGVDYVRTHKPEPRSCLRSLFGTVPRWCVFLSLWLDSTLTLLDQKKPIFVAADVPIVWVNSSAGQNEVCSSVAMQRATACVPRLPKGIGHSPSPETFPLVKPPVTST